MAFSRVLLGVFAHPDDESFGPGGTLAKYAAEGAQVHVVIATDGIAGSVADGFDVTLHETLAKARATELSNAAIELGIASVWSMPYRDSGMNNSANNGHPAALIQQPLDCLIAEIAGYIERLQPQVVVTHDPFGGYGHPDHVRICEAVTAAFFRARQQRSNGASNGWPNKLYYTAFDKRMLKLVVKFMSMTGKDPARVGRNQDINLVEISQWYMPVHASIDVGPYLDRKMAASQAHVSQYSGGPSYMRFLPGIVQRRMLRFDKFTRAFPPADGRLERDLYEGIA